MDAEIADFGTTVNGREIDLDLYRTSSPLFALTYPEGKSLRTAAGCLALRIERLQPDRRAAASGRARDHHLGAQRRPTRTVRPHLQPDRRSTPKIEVPPTTA
jgi:hypothetical protein